jgi:hypothetical protein
MEVDTNNLDSVNMGENENLSKLRGLCCASCPFVPWSYPDDSRIFMPGSLKPPSVIWRLPMKTYKTKVTTKFGPSGLI